MSGSGSWIAAGVPAGSAVRPYEQPKSLVIHHDRVWMPIETTILAEGFTRAWQVAALHWRQHADAGPAGFFTTRDAWNSYTPVSPSLDVSTGRPDGGAGGIGQDVFLMDWVESGAAEWAFRVGTTIPGLTSMRVRGTFGMRYP